MFRLKEQGDSFHLIRVRAVRIDKCLDVADASQDEDVAVHHI
jgi:hypothetical protein